MPAVSTVQTHADFTASHNRLILGTTTDILQSEDLPGLLKISDTLWNFIVEQLSKTTELQLFLEQKKRAKYCQAIIRDTIHQVTPIRFNKHAEESAPLEVGTSLYVPANATSMDKYVLSQKPSLLFRQKHPLYTINKFMSYLS